MLIASRKIRTLIKLLLRVNDRGKDKAIYVCLLLTHFDKEIVGSQTLRGLPFLFVKSFTLIVIAPFHYLSADEH